VLTNDLKEVEGFVESVARAAVGGNV
jgi:hypothetical protein